MLAAHEKSAGTARAMNNRYRDDSILLRNFIQDARWATCSTRAPRLKRRERTSRSPGSTSARSGGGVVMDLGIQLLDLVLCYAAIRAGARDASFYYHMRGSTSRTRR